MFTNLILLCVVTLDIVTDIIVIFIISLQEVIVQLYKRGVSIEGAFRKSPNYATLKSLKEVAKQGGEANFSGTDIFVVASFIKVSGDLLGLVWIKCFTDYYDID